MSSPSDLHVANGLEAATLLAEVADSPAIMLCNFKGVPCAHQVTLSAQLVDAITAWSEEARQLERRPVEAGR